MDNIRQSIKSRVSLESDNRVPSTLNGSTSNIPIPIDNGKIELSNERNTGVSMNQTSSGTLSFHRISYAVKGKKLTKQEKQIIDDVSGVFRSGMNAIMGPTGCGKSSLLDILADRKDPHGLSGLVLIDGHPPPPCYKYIVGYVVQDDIISGTLTVRENLMFSANVRLPNDVSADERRERVTKVIQDLGLESCAETKIGTELLRGVSGGERKRTCIAMELVLSPKILFLDEPTTGLDASTARNVMECLKELSRSGRTIIFSIHQPRYSIFKLFDHILLMCKGRHIYQGSASAMLPYFTTHGYQCELHDNPADFALDILIDASRKSEDFNKLNQAYIESQIQANINSQSNFQLHDDRSEILRRTQQRTAGRSFGPEIYYVSQRTLRNAIRNPELFLSQIAVATVLGLLVGLVFYDMKLTTDPGVQNRLGAIAFIVISQIFSTITAIEPLLKERVLFLHENASGYYRISTYFLAKLICDVLPMRVIPSVLFSLIAYFMTGFQRSAGQFFIFLITIFMTSLCGSAICFFVSAAIPMFAVALIIIVLIFVIMFVFSGFLISLDSIFNWLVWIQWMSAVRYASNVLTINEFCHLRFCLANDTHTCPLMGTEILQKQALDCTTNWNMWKYLFALTMMPITFLFLAYIQLFRIKKTK